MVKVSAPMLSLDASGALAGSIVFSKWKGRNYVRTLVTPANPRSPGQVSVRAMFKFLAQKWADLGAAQKATWEDRAETLVVSPFNAFVGYNQQRWRSFDAPSDRDPADETGTLPTVTAFTATAGERSITLDWTVNPHANGWGVLIFRDVTAAFAVSWDNLIHVGLANATASFDHVDTPLAAGTFYYNLRTFTKYGRSSGNWGEVNASVT